MKIFKGKVVSKKMKKTAVVEVVRMVSHPVYKKKIKKTKKYHVHDEIGVETGQAVQFKACKPRSKTKRWEIVPQGTKKKIKK